MTSGFLLIDKPIDWTSHDVVGYLRRVTHIKKIGHAGTLDPFATGLLIVAIGREATKRIDKFKNLPKTYETTIRLGATSDTQDRTGNIKECGTWDEEPITKEKIQGVLHTFLGKQMQTPPMYSAKKVAGKKLYELARKGIEIERQAHEIEIYDIELLHHFPSPCRGGSGKGLNQGTQDKHEDPLPTSPYQVEEYPSLSIRCHVSVGTYIRTLAYDIGKKLDVGAYCEELRRTRIGDYSVDNAKEPKEITEKNWKSHLFQK